MAKETEIPSDSTHVSIALIITRSRSSVLSDAVSSPGATRYGVTLYTHGSQLDQPLAATRTDLGCCAWLGSGHRARRPPILPRLDS
jgi:hypothetical protein